MSEMSAGWATKDITPEPGVPLGGRGPQFTGIDTILDPLYAQAILLEDQSGSRALVVSLDLVGIGTTFSFELRQNLAALTGAPYESIILNFSHTHSGPMTIMDKYPVIADPPVNLVAYEQKLAADITEVALEAMNALTAVSVSSFTGTTNIGMNRRQKQSDGEILMQPDPDGFIVREIWGLDLRKTDSSGMRCVLFSAACHAVTVYSWLYAACSADYPGAARNELRKALGDDVHAQFLQGFGGNVRPARLADGETRQFRSSEENDHLEIGKMLSNDVQAALVNNASPISLDLRGAAGRFRAFRDADRMETAEHWSGMAGSDNELERNFGRYWFEAIKHDKPLARCVPWEIGLLQIGPDITVAWLAGEVCGEWLPLIRSWIGDDRLHGIGYCQDLPGYLPTAKLIEEGGYEVIRSNWYRKTGPAPFGTSIEEEARTVFLALQEAIQ
jgi:neutral ceramidase